MANKDIHEAIDKAGILKWQIADELGIADSTLSKWLRKELSDDKKAKILDIISSFRKVG